MMLWISAYKPAYQSRERGGMPTVTGIVQDEQGKPVSNALIAVESGSALYADIALLTDNRGYFTIHLPQGRFRLGVHSEHSGNGFIECELTNSDINLLIQLDSQASPMSFNASQWTSSNDITLN